MKIILIRHGETEENKARIIQGWHPGNLSKEGIEQVKKVAERLKDESIKVIYSSDLSRAKNTAEEISKFHDVDFVIDKRLRERCNGIYDGKSVEERRVAVSAVEVPFYRFRAEDGESYEDVIERIKGFVEEIVANHDNETVVLVSHGGTISCLSCYLMDESLEKMHDYRHSNTGVTYLEKTDDGWKIVKLNCTEHLE